MVSSPRGRPWTSTLGGGDFELRTFVDAVFFGSPAKEPLAGQNLPQNDRGRKDVGAAVEALSANLLGRHVRRLSFDHAGLRLLAGLHRAGDAKIEDSRNAIDADQDVLRRDVAMDDFERLALFTSRLVRRVQPLEHPHHDGGANGRRDALCCCRDAFRKKLRDSPCTYSITKTSSSPLSTTSSVGTTLGWRMRAARRASSMNIALNSGSLSKWGCRHLTATTRENPTGPARRAKCTVAMPPDAISSKIA